LVLSNCFLCLVLMIGISMSASWSAGITQLIATAGRMKITRTSPIARNIDRGNSRPGFRSDETCTAFISMPE